MIVDVMIKNLQLYDLKHTLAGAYLGGYEYPWQALHSIAGLIISLGVNGLEGYVQVSKNVWVHRSAKVDCSARICAPCIIGAESEVRHCAYIRGGALIGNNCVIGNSTELKNVIIFDGAQLPHFNYVGDSIVGYKAHMGAGAITSNVKADRGEVVIHARKDMATGLKKVGAFIGDCAEIGCNCVLNPGSVIGRNSIVYPLTAVRGAVPAGSILKGNGMLIKRSY